MEGSMWGEIELTWGEIEMNLKNKDGEDWNEHWKTQKLRTWMEGVLDLYKSGNELSLDLHMNKSPKWNSSFLDFWVCHLNGCSY